MIAVLLISGLSLFTAIGVEVLLAPRADASMANLHNGPWQCLAD
jgi:hypothetical protein